MTASAAPARPVYLDNQATTPLDRRVLDEMLPWFGESFGNPHSTTHERGRAAARAVERARGQVAALVGARPREIVFTSGATESNNLAIKGAARFEKRRRGGRDKVVTVATEHKCVIESVKEIAGEGFETVLLPVEPNGLVDPDLLARTVDERTVLVSVMAANNEIGVLQPLARIGALARRRGALFHTDAAQAAGKVPLDIEADAVDLLSLSGHKLYGPAGVGALYVRRRPRARVEPLISGGGQERALRSGTVPTPLAVGFGEACALALAAMEEEARGTAALRDRLYRGLRARVPGLALNGDAERRLPGNLNLAIDGIDAMALIARVPELAFSTGSACTSAAVEPSYVLRALGLAPERAASSVRLSIGRFTSESDVDLAIDRLAAAIGALRAAAAA